MIVYFDLDGALIDHNDVPRPYVKEVFELLHANECAVAIWSASEPSYIQRQAVRLLEKLEINFPVIMLVKEPKSLIGHDDSIVVDNSKSELEDFERHGMKGYKVAEYDSNLMPNDRQLLDIVEEILNIKLPS